MSATRSQLCKLLNLKSLIFKPSRCNSTVSGTVFDKSLRIKHLDRSAIASEAHIYDYLRDYAARDLTDRVEDLTSKDKRFVLSLSSCSGLVAKNINPDRVDTIVECDISRESLKRSRNSNKKLGHKLSIDYINSDEEIIPFKSDLFDIAISCLNLHWVNDLQSCFRQVRRALKDNSPFIGCLYGGDTLYELRSSLQLAELERLSGFSPHCAPKTTGQDLAGLLQSTGFGLITVDNSDIRIRYPSMFELMFDLQGMGESNSSIHGSRHMNRDVVQAAAAIYQQLYGTDNVDDGVPATFQVIHFIGWKNPVRST